MPAPIPRPLTLPDISQALRDAGAVLARTPLVSTAFTLVFACAGAVLAIVLWRLGLTLMLLPLASGFMLIGPAFLGGFFRIRHALRTRGEAGFGDIVAGLFSTSAELWALSLILAFLFFIWITDAGVLYSFTVGGDVADWLESSAEVGGIQHFLFWGSLMGAVLATASYVISVFSVPLLLERRASLVAAVIASVHAVRIAPVACLVWGALLAATLIPSALFPPLLLLTLPLMSYASEGIYRRVFPAG